MPKTRKYEQRLRAEAAEETRQRILAAVDERLREAPSEPVSVDRVARLAGVARSTVYLVFGSRSGLLGAYTEHVFERAGFERLIENVALPDTRERVIDGLRIGTEIFAADRDVFRALYSMSALDPDAVGGAIARWEERRTEGLAVIAERLDSAGLLRPGVTAQQAADRFWVYTSFDTFDLLYTGRGMSVNQTAETIIDMASRSLLAEPS
jgi:AcrR family transcriptional regulator